MNCTAKKLHVLYDGSCPLCIRSAMWLAAQIKYVPIVLISAQQAIKLPQYSHIDIGDPPEDLIVVTDDNNIYRNDEAFLICLYMLRNYRPWAKILSAPKLRPLARKAYFYLSRNRQGLSRWIPGARNLLGRINAYHDPHCHSQCYAEKNPATCPHSGQNIRRAPFT